jgi:hypothetical protein
MRRLLLGLSSAVIALRCSALTLRSGDVVQLSSGQVVRVATQEDLKLDSTGKKPESSSEYVLFQDSIGTRIVLESKQKPDGRTESKFSSPSGSSRIEFQEDLGFGRKGLPDPVTVSINGERFHALIDRQSPASSDAFREKLRASAQALPVGVRNALRELFALGQAGYSQLGDAWVDLLYVFDPSELVAHASILAKTPMTAEEREAFVSGFSAK